MVRLKVSNCQTPVLAYAEFQFHYGAIKGISRQKSRAALGHFNSTMVRLKEGRQSLDNIRKLLFQFHYGAIKGTREDLQVILED